VAGGPLEERFERGGAQRELLAEALQVDERRSQVVRHAVDEAFVFRAFLFEFAIGGGQFHHAAFQLAGQPLDAFFVRLALADVTRDLGEAAQGAIAVPQRGDDDVGKEASAVFAHTPPFVLEAAHPCGFDQRVIRPLPRDRVRRLERGKVTAHDLVRRVSLDALGAGVPARDEPARVEQEDGVIGGALDQEPKRIVVRRHEVRRRRSPSSLLVHAAPWRPMTGFSMSGNDF